MKRVLAVYLALTATAVALNLILTPVYHDGSPDYPTWKVLNFFMAAGVLITLAVSALRRFRPSDGGSDSQGLTLDYLRVAASWYGSVVLTMLFFWEWFWTLNPGSETGDAVTSHLIYFPIVDALMVVLALTTARYLWRADTPAE